MDPTDYNVVNDGVLRAIQDIAKQENRPLVEMLTILYAKDAIRKDRKLKLIFLIAAVEFGLILSLFFTR